MSYSSQARRDRINPHFPKLVEMTNDYVYGDVWERPQLSKRDRSLVTIAALVALGWEDQLKSHIGRGLTNGLTREEISEIVTHLAMYSGWPSAMTAAHVATDVFERRTRRRADVMKVGFIGLGTMGAFIAANLQKAGHTLVDPRRSPRGRRQSPRRRRGLGRTRRRRWPSSAR